MNNSFNLQNTNQYQILDFTKFKKISKSNSIIYLSNEEYELLKSLESFPKLKDYDFIVNMRGELDLTASKDFITNDDTNLTLLRGRNISFYKLDLNETLNVKEDFLKHSTKSYFIKNLRIACQQISNINKTQRLVFSLVKPNYVLGNSCNFIFAGDNDFYIDIYYLMGLLNSPILNWYFKVNSSNNHVSNYEIDMLPIPNKPTNIIIKISELVKRLIDLNGDDLNLINDINELVYEIYNVNFENNFIKKNSKVSKGMDNLDKKYIGMLKKDLEEVLQGEKIPMETLKNILNCNLKNDSIKMFINLPNDIFLQEVIYKIIEKYQKLYKGIILNHTTFKLSELDLKMISHIPQGGNWKHIPKDIVKLSKRLIRINETGGRTTLYGRIAYSEPSYTITTYFNRPGNGTYVHPIHNRVISVREAARLQSFDDDYYFVGNKTNLLNQVGNAVPPILAYEIAKHIRTKLEINSSIDLFSGAGGLTLGFKKAGINSIVGVDFDKSACLTLKVNNPEINVICGDLTLDETKNQIYKAITKYKIDIICGGPPCQGFSMAGKRFIDDPRNKLFKEYVEILEKVKPKVFLFENVIGIKSMKNGKVFSEIFKSFSNIGYRVHSETMMANDYGVPQKRKRVIIIGLRNDIDIDPKDLFPEPINTTISAKEAIYDLESIECDDNAFYRPNKQLSNYVRKLRKME